jgi:hypothetical protein
VRANDEWGEAWTRLQSARTPLVHKHASQAVHRAASATRGFLAEEEGDLLFGLAADIAGVAPCLEVGSYCGKSAIYLGAGCREANGHPLFTIDHHRGSVEQQKGQEYFDPEVFDERAGRVDTLPHLVESLQRAELTDWVIPLITRSSVAGRGFAPASLGLVFIDGGHAEEDVSADVRGFATKVVSGGFLCVHDLFTSALDGGQAPYRAFEALRRDGAFNFFGQVKTLGVLRRK